MFDLPIKLAARAEELLMQEYGSASPVKFDIPMDEGRGDLTTSVALQMAKALGKKPRDIADLLAKGLKTVDGVDSTEVGGAGYVNISVKPAVFLGVLTVALDDCEPKAIRKKEAPIIVEYSQPNIAKPLGIHHILSTTIGQVLSNVHRHLGYNTVSINHIGDWGTQFGKLAVAHKKWGTKPAKECSIDDLLDLYVKFHSEAEKDSALEDEGRAAFKKLEDGDKALRAFWKDTVTVTMAAIDTLYKRLHVSFDHVQGESFYEDKMQPIIEEGKNNHVFKNGNEGALIAEFSDELHLPPAIVLKGDGSTIYMTRDLATIRYRVDTWHPQEILYVVDRAQEMYFKQMFEVVKQLQWQVPHLEHVVFGRMRFADKSMSTRKGNILRLEHVLDDAVERATELIKERGEAIQTDNPQELAEMMGVGSVVYGILSQNRKMDMVFDWKKVLSFEGNSAPYLQYTHARACSVLRKSGAKKFPLPKKSDALTSHERGVMRRLAVFGKTLESARAEREPHRISNYLYDLAQAFNSFYNADSILTAPESQKAQRLAITSAVATVLKTGSELLTLRVPQSM